MARTEDASKYSIRNTPELNKSKLAGCYYCMSTFDVSEINETVDDGQTALCPKCGIDSVLPDTSPFELTAKRLKELNSFWF